MPAKMRKNIPPYDVKTGTIFRMGYFDSFLTPSSNVLIQKGLAGKFEQILNCGTKVANTKLGLSVWRQDCV